MATEKVQPVPKKKPKPKPPMKITVTIVPGQVDSERLDRWWTRMIGKIVIG